MPRMSRKYCLKTPVNKMGFSQKSSCKAQGYIARTSRKNKGKYIISPKYKKSKSKKIIDSGKKSLYNNGNKKPRTITGYKDKETALQTLKNIKNLI